MVNDIRMAVRSLLRTPAFTATTVLTLALAAGAGAAIFAVVYGILLRPLPFPDEDRLVAVWPGRFQSNADLLYIRDHGAMFSHLAAVAPGWTMALTGSGEPTRMTVARVSGNLFDTFGTEPLLGRPFGESAARPGMAGTMVLDYRFWMKQFGGDAGVIGRTVQLDGSPVRIVAVMPRGFEVFGLRADAYTPLVMDASAWYHRLSFSLYAARLAPGESLAQANAAYLAVLQQLRRERSYTDDFGRNASLVNLKTALVGDVSASLVVLGAAVGLILLLAGANAGTLQLTRARARSADLAIRSALGASRGRIVREVVAENLLLATAGGLLGVAAAKAALPMLLAMMPGDTPRLQEIAVDSMVSAIVMAAAVLVGLSAGAGPVLNATRLGPAPLMRMGTGTETGAAKRLRASLVAAEVALAVVLSIGAGLMIQTLWTLRHVDPGFRADGLLTLHVQPSGATHRDLSVADYYDRMLERLRALPGVTAAGAVQHLPFSNYSWTIPFEAEGHAVPAGMAAPSAGARIITPGYFAAIGLPILAGREIERADAASQRVAVVNEVLASRYFGSPAAAIGRTVRQRSARGPGERLTIVGVVGNVRHTALTASPGPEIYTSVSSTSINAMMLAIRAGGEPASLVPSVREAIRSIDPAVPLSDIETMEAKIGASLGRPRLLLTLLGAFAVVGGVLAVVGVYGVTAFSVAQRSRELGIMVALGAERGRIVRSVLREAAFYAIAGLIVGLPAAFAGSRLMRNLVFGVSTTDPATYAATGIATLGVVLLASALPAVRAARVDPVSALKGS